MKECESCGSMVSEQFARVFGSNHQVVYRCPDCPEFEDKDITRHLQSGAAAKEEYELIGMGGRRI